MKCFGVFRVSQKAGILLAVSVLIIWFSITVCRLLPDSVTTGGEAADNIPQLPVIMYHHFSSDAGKFGDYTISPEQFESDLQEIWKRGYTAISAAQLRNYYQHGKSLPEKSILLTFDDGYYSVYALAYPLLQKYQMPAVCFILGYYTELYSSGEKQDIRYGHMTWEQLRQMQNSGLVEMGNHTWNLHTARGKGERYGISANSGENTESYQSKIDADIGMLSNKMEQELGKRPDCFAYPFGALDRKADEVLKKQGFLYLFTCEEKVNLLNRRDGLIQLGRFNRPAGESSEDFFNRFSVSE